MIKKIALIFLGLFLISFAFADLTNPVASSSLNPTSAQLLNPSFSNYYSSSDIATYWPILGNNSNQQCTANNNFLVLIPPFGCTPEVVTSNLLSQQNVPVFCQLESLNTNPLIKVSSIKSISFQGNYPASVSGVSYHPSQAALNSYNTLLGSPTANNIGYVVIVLKQQQNESASNQTVTGNLTATMYYDAEKAFGVGSSEFYLKTMDDQEWAINYNANSFWGGRGYIRLIDLQADHATVQLLTDQNHVFQTMTLKLGETSGITYFPGFYCTAGLQVKLNSVVSSDDEALLNVDGDAVQVRKGSTILNGRCTVTSLNIIGGSSGTVQLSCGGTNYALSLETLLKAGFNVDGASVSASNIGDKVFTNPDGTSWYIAYSGLTGQQIQKRNSNPASFFAPNSGFVVLVRSKDNPTTGDYSDIAAQISNKFKVGSGLTQDSFEKAISTKYTGANIITLFNEPSYNNDPTRANNIVLTGLTNAQTNVPISSPIDAATTSLINNYFSLGDSAVQDLLKYYPTAGGSLTKSGEQAILEEIQLIDDLSAKGVRHDDQKAALLNEFIKLYPTSSNLPLVQSQLDLMTSKDTTNAFKNVYVNNGYHSISLTSFTASDITKKNFQLYVDGKTAFGTDVKKTTFGEGDIINLSMINKDDKSNDYLIVKSVQPTTVTVDFYGNSGNDAAGKPINKIISSSVILNYNINSPADNSKSIQNGAKSYTLSLFNINVNQVAYVSLIPSVTTSSQANFTYTINIEQRSIQESPEQAAQEANALNKTIQTWTDRNAKLGSLVESWKAACLVTGLGLNIKNLITGFSGEALARQQVMQYYQSDCRQKVASDPSTYPTVDVCYNKESDVINSDVAAYTAAIQDLNTRILNKYQTVDDWKKSTDFVQETLDIGGGRTVSTSQLTLWTQVKAVLIYDELQNKVSSPYATSLKATRDNLLSSIWSDANANKAMASLSSNLPQGLQGAVFGLTNNQKVDFTVNNFQSMTVSTLKNYVIDDSAGDFNKYIGAISSDAVIGVDIEPIGANTKMIVILNAGNTAATKTSATFNVTTNTDKVTITGLDTKSVVAINPNAGKQCSYTYQNPTIRFYDTDPGKGMPQVTPFDTKNGWYVYVQQSSGGLLSNNVQSVQASGALQFYYICNVGPNGKEENMGGDDICQSFNINNYNSVGEFGACSLSSSQFISLANQAQAAFRQAASQYANGVKSITIPGVDKPLQVTPGVSSSSAGTQCEDFMSPEDCQLMYNVCDPVICPSSRCNFGGKIPVADVIQSGIVGSLLLCSKNFIGFGGDVAIPICLTGLHAGIEGYISILQAQQTCLNDYAATGQHTGICDEMTAVYKCEFFWQQVAPLTQTLIPSLFNFASNGGSVVNQGGGEYATFQASWDNMQKSLDYFRNTYASTSFSAVSFSDISSIGNQVCQNFIGTSVPNSASVVDQLLKPESPVQFYAQFTETPFTQATVPATSQYSVFYQIYSGTDQGTQFQIYLKNPPATSYYSTAQTVPVRSGYISTGQQDSQTVVFTAPAGYKQLCVVINNQEQCGFTSVSTDFGVNALHDLYAQQQGADTNIQTEQQCIQGTQSALALGTSINVQAGVQQAISPNIALSGIVRVCATQNPGAGTNPNDWVAVGSCANGLYCWLQNSSVNVNAMNVLKNVGTIAGAQSVISANNVSADPNVAASLFQQFSDNVSTLGTALSGVLGSSTNGALTTTQSTQLQIDTLLNQKIGDSNSFNSFVSMLGLDTLQAEAYRLRFNAYETVVRNLSNSYVSAQSALGSTAATTNNVQTVSPPVVNNAVATTSVASAYLTPIGTDGTQFSIITTAGSPVGKLIKAPDNSWSAVPSNGGAGGSVPLNQALSFSGDLAVLNTCTFNGAALLCGGSSTSTQSSSSANPLDKFSGSSTTYLVYKGTNYKTIADFIIRMGRAPYSIWATSDDIISNINQVSGQETLSNSNPVQNVIIPLFSSQSQLLPPISSDCSDANKQDVFNATRCTSTSFVISYTQDSYGNYVGTLNDVSCKVQNNQCVQA